MSFRRLEKVASWRALAVHAWDAPRDPTVYGIIDIDAGNALAYVERMRRESGKRITLTHLIGKALALAIAERPEVNAIIRRGRIYVRDTVDIFFQVAFEGGEELAGAKVTRVNVKSVAEIADELSSRAERIRVKKDDPTQQSARLLTKLPPALTRFAMKLGERLTYDYDLNLTKYGVPYDAFGSAMITNVSNFGLTVGQAPLFPPSRTPICLTIGAVREAPAVVDGRVEVRPLLTIGASFDHRVADGYQAGRMAKRFREVLEEPDRELEERK
jgi:pyruvate dehydrogenase E2 component (dihydrolipoamide acetyltransferase)